MNAAHFSNEAHISSIRPLI